MIDRIRKLIDYESISVRAFEQSIGASNGLIRKAIANNTDIQGKWLSVIADNYPHISCDWLITGKGEMLRSESRQDINIVDQKSVGFILDRYEALVRENEKLRNEIDLLKSGKKQSAGVVSPAFIEKEIKSLFAAERGEKYEKK